MSDAGFRDHFSGIAERYAATRPDYPAALFDALAAHAPSHERAWDCATGSGQAASGLARHFDLVVATDASTPQVAHGRAHPRIRYASARAEAAPLSTGAFAIVTVAQALHWLDVDRFYREARRVVMPGGIVAVWSYNRARVTSEIDAIVDRFHSDTIGPYWPAERHHVESGYRTLPFPFDPLPMPALTMEREMTAAQFLAYLRTWSAVQRFQKARDADPVRELEPALTRAWGTESRVARWPVAIRVGRITR